MYHQFPQLFDLILRTLIFWRFGRNGKWSTTHTYFSGHIRRQAGILNDARIDNDPIDTTTTILYLEAAWDKQASTNLAIIREPDIVNFEMTGNVKHDLASCGKPSFSRFFLLCGLKSTPSSFARSWKDPNSLGRRSTWNALFLPSNLQ